MKRSVKLIAALFASIAFICILGVNTSDSVIIEGSCDFTSDTGKGCAGAYISYHDLLKSITRSYPVDVTEKMQLLGNPFKKETYARNVWDMQVFNGSIYLGHGNSSNYGPAINAGPIDIIKYNPVSNKFIKEFTVDEEQIDIFKIINGKLYIPGHDSRDSWEFGNFYSLNSGKWNKIRTVPEAIHMYDITDYNGKLYAATGSDGFGEVVSSEDYGQTWEAVKAATRFITYGMRAYTLFEFKDKLYATSILTNTNNVSYNNLLCVDGSKVSVVDINGKKMFPDMEGKAKILKLVHPVVFNDTLLYIAGEADNDHQNIPIAIYTSTEIGNAKKVTFCDSSAVPYDILVRDSSVYVLTSVKDSTNKFKNTVYQSDDLNTWDEIFYFTSDAFTRSFEELNGDFYLGLGCDTAYMPQSTGSILKVSKSDYKYNILMP